MMLKEIPELPPSEAGYIVADEFACLNTNSILSSYQDIKLSCWIYLARTAIPAPRDSPRHKTAHRRGN